MASLWNVCDSLLSCFRGERSYSVTMEMDDMEGVGDVQVRAEGCFERVQRIWNGWSCVTKVCVVATGCIVTTGVVLSIGAIAYAAVGGVAIAATGLTTQSTAHAGAIVADNTTHRYQTTNRISNSTLKKILETEAGETTYRSTQETIQSTINSVTGEIYRPITDRVQRTSYGLQSSIENQKTEASTKSKIDLETETKTNKPIEASTSRINYVPKEVTKQLTTYQESLKEDLTTIKQLFTQTSWITDTALRTSVESKQATAESIVKSAMTTSVTNAATSAIKTPGKVTQSTTTVKTTPTTVKTTPTTVKTTPIPTIGWIAKTITINKETKICTVKGWYPEWVEGEWGRMYLEAEVAPTYYRSYDFYRSMMSWSCRVQRYNWTEKNADMAFSLLTNGKFFGKGFAFLKERKLRYNYYMEGMICSCTDRELAEDSYLLGFFKEAHKECKALVRQVPWNFYKR